MLNPYVVSVITTLIEQGEEFDHRRDYPRSMVICAMELADEWDKDANLWAWYAVNAYLP